jgi:hypothetical protein
MVYYLNDKGLHDFGKRMIISKLLGGGATASAVEVGGSLGGRAPFFKLWGGGLSPPSTLENR